MVAKANLNNCPAASKNNAQLKKGQNQIENNYTA
jgi:hypothetical protein